MDVAARCAPPSATVVQDRDALRFRPAHRLHDADRQLGSPPPEWWAFSSGRPVYLLARAHFSSDLLSIAWQHLLAIDHHYLLAIEKLKLLVAAHHDKLVCVRHQSLEGRHPWQPPMKSSPRP
jgi:hypothetical protein